MDSHLVLTRRSARPIIVSGSPWMSVALRTATPADAAVLTELAHAAKRHWGYPEHWVELWCAALTITPDFIRRHPVYLAAAGGTPVGFYALIHGPGCTLEHLWVLPEWMGQGIGRLLFEHALHTAAALGATQLDLEADPHAE